MEQELQKRSENEQSLQKQIEDLKFQITKQQQYQQDASRSGGAVCTSEINSLNAKFNNEISKLQEESRVLKETIKNLNAILDRETQAKNTAETLLNVEKMAKEELIQQNNEQIGFLQDQLRSLDNKLAEVGSNLEQETSGRQLLAKQYDEVMKNQSDISLKYRSELQRLIDENKNLTATMIHEKFIKNEVLKKIQQENEELNLKLEANTKNFKDSSNLHQTESKKRQELEEKLKKFEESNSKERKRCEVLEVALKKKDVEMAKLDARHKTEMQRQLDYINSPRGQMIIYPAPRPGYYPIRHG